jgi:uncharacterized protein YheU (UPF0270 family)
MTESTSRPDDSSDEPVSGVELEFDQLSPEALRGLVEEFVTREGTDYGDGRGGRSTSQPDREWTLEDKVSQILDQLDRGEARIVFDLELGTASITRQQDSDSRVF